MIVKGIHFPDGIYHYRQHRKPDGTLGNRYDLERVEGKLYPFMFTTLKRCGTRVIYLGKHPKPKKVSLITSCRPEKRRIVGAI